MKDNEYQCTACGNVYEKGWDDSESDKEAEDVWGVKDASKNSDMVVICDDCFNHRTPAEIKAMGNEFKSL